MADFLSLLTAVPSLISDFTGSTSNPNKKKIGQINSALSDTTNPLYQQLYGQYRQQNVTNLSKGIAEAEAQNRLANRMGRTPLFNNERSGEQSFRSLMSGYQTAGTQADQQTRQNLQQQLQNLSGTSQATAQGNAQRLAGYQGIYDLLTNKKKQQGQQTAQSGQDSSISGFLSNLLQSGNSGQSSQQSSPSWWSYNQ